MKPFNFHIPTKIVFRKGITDYIEDEIPKHYKNILIVTDSVLYEKTNIISKIIEALSEREITVFKEVEENPLIATIEQGKEASLDCKADLIIGCGGGSGMDAAKGIALLATNSKSLSRYLEGDEPENDPLPIICIPTTSGTGSEVTPYAVFSDVEDSTKKAIAHDKLFPLISFIDPELTYSMPKQVITNTGLDVLTHAVEAYLSEMAFEMNDNHALQAIEIVIEYLPQATHNNKEAMDKMAYASMLAGIAISHASTILPHIMGYPLTVFHNIPHGLSNAIVLPAFLDYLQRENRKIDKMKKLNRLFADKGGIGTFINGLGVSTKLSDYGVRKEELPEFVEKVIHKDDVKITPGEISREVIFNVYNQSF